MCCSLVDCLNLFCSDWGESTCCLLLFRWFVFSFSIVSLFFLYYINQADAIFLIFFCKFFKTLLRSSSVLFVLCSERCWGISKSLTGYILILNNGIFDRISEVHNWLRLEWCVFVCFGIIPLNISLSYYSPFEVLICNFS